MLKNIRNNLLYLLTTSKDDIIMCTQRSISEIIYINNTSVL